MPIAFDPDQTAEFSLKTDQGKPAATRPAFICRFLTRRQLAEHDRLIDQAQKGGNEFWDLVWKAILLGVTGWKNMPTQEPFSREAAEAILTGSEIAELAGNYPDAVRLAERDRKNLPSPQSPTGALVAEAAAPAA